MAAGVIRTLNTFRLARPGQPCFITTEEDELDDDCNDELGEDAEDSLEDEDPLATVATDPCSSQTEATDRLLRFAELISSDVQRYFGRSRDTDTCDVYAGSPRGHCAAPAAQGDEPKKLGPLAELFQEVCTKKQGLPMIQRRLPSSFWTEPRPDYISTGASIPDALGCCSNSSSITPDFSDLLEHWASERDNPTDFSCDYQLP